MNNVNFTVINKLSENIIFSYQYENCYKCLPENVTITSNSNLSLLLNIVGYFQSNVYLINNSYSAICSYKRKMESGVLYNYFVQQRKMENDTKYNCSLMTNSERIIDYLLPIYVLGTLLCFCGALYYTLLMLYRHRIFQKCGSKLFLYKVDLMEDFGRPGSISNIDIDDDYQSYPTLSTTLSTERRLRGLDTFRGLSVVIMVFVNYGGGGYWFFDHSVWNGVTLVDLVFPWFVFVMGITISISIYRNNRRTQKKLHWIKTWLNGCKRSIILFIIGIALESPQSNGELKSLRIMGPLQRLAGGYFCLLTTICIVAYLKSKCCKTHLLTDVNENLIVSNDINFVEKQNLFCRCRNIFKDLWICLPYIFISLVLLIAHACISLLLKVPDCPLGYLGPGGIGDNGCCDNCSGGVAGYIDRLILTQDHMYSHSTATSLYFLKQAYDPEGILGYLTCTALCFLGYWAGNVVLLHDNWSGAIKRLLIYAIICTLIGVGLCEAKTNGGFIPINKNLWSVSFVMVTAGTSFFLLAFLFATVDVFKLWNGSPFKYPGMNSIVIYCGHIILKNTFPVHWNVSKEYIYKLIMDIWGAVFWTGIGYIMYVKKIFITV